MTGLYCLILSRALTLLNDRTGLLCSSSGSFDKLEAERRVGDIDLPLFAGEGLVLRYTVSDGFIGLKSYSYVKLSFLMWKDGFVTDSV